MSWSRSSSPEPETLLPRTSAARYIESQVEDSGTQDGIGIRQNLSYEEREKRRLIAEIRRQDEAEGEGVPAPKTGLPYDDEDTGEGPDLSEDEDESPIKANTMSESKQREQMAKQLREEFDDGDDDDDDDE
ncbi:hypothetical protein VTN96DRAFT_5342 [Rasamsonia emersonii]|uniref:Uncharacterized protein n=1 Tax=Rasamsonia emersonii (strain ATCC 16479 / CBS 393.64 / IMI 116815) TaxID=1408163 RepID=A0A0F4YYK6_RASE3|nr:hypothetical protein T310_2797 [Rasamsonia emersonii CBS 393.64]KKA23165.1 hypothetical protein T310_2797 [Rasamsonia emersonii CBS 393.64]